MITIGIDIGTSGVKAALVRDGDQVLAHSSQPLTVSRPQPGFSEQHPEHWWLAACAALDELRSQAPQALADTTAIGLSGQMHGATLLDARGEVLRPCILWNDGRSDLECAELERRWPALRRVTGNIAMPGFTAPKLCWVRKHEPEIFARVAKVLLPKAYLRWRLSGEYAEDCSDASGTLWLDVGARRWSAEALAACHMSLEQMPRLVEGSEAAGQGGQINLYRADGTVTISIDADFNGDGRIITQELQITGGSDLSEQFDVRTSDGSAVQPGMLVCIDPAHPGALAVAGRAYDKTVAGIVSGAGGVKTGMSMGQKGTAADGRHAVALTGRVYCYVDATVAAVEPGDLLTSSDTPGYAMKAADHERAQGAAIGKAMTPLAKGEKGLVLVLVNLQ